METYRSGHNGADSKLCGFVDGPTSEPLGISGLSGSSTLFNNFISTVFLRFVLRFLRSALLVSKTRKALGIQHGDVSKRS